MECRWALLLAVGVLGSAAGCAHNQQTATGSLASGGLAGSQPDGLRAQASTDPSSGKAWLPRKPTASQCVLLGNIREQSVESALQREPPLSSAEKDLMYDQARRAYQKALEVDPKYLPAYTSLAALYEKRGNHERAIATYHQARKAHPKEASLPYELGMCHARHKEWGPALESLRAACELDPENPHYGKTLGFCLARSGHYDQSLVYLKKHLGEAEAYYSLARMLRHMKQDEGSKQYARMALEVNPQLTGAQQLLAELEGQAPAPTSPTVHAEFSTVD